MSKTATREEIFAIIRDFLDKDWRSLELDWGDYEVILRKQDCRQSHPAPVAAPVAVAPATEVTPTETSADAPAAEVLGAATTTHADGPTEGFVVTAPMMGTFYQAPSSGAGPFVSLGGAVAAGQSLCIVEVMKLMTRVESAVSGVVTAVHVADGDLVMEGQPLFTIRQTADAS